MVATVAVAAAVAASADGGDGDAAGKKQSIQSSFCMGNNGEGVLPLSLDRPVPSFSFPAFTQLNR